MLSPPYTTKSSTPADRGKRGSQVSVHHPVAAAVGGGCSRTAICVRVNRGPATTTRTSTCQQAAAGRTDRPRWTSPPVHGRDDPHRRVPSCSTTKMTCPLPKGGTSRAVVPATATSQAGRRGDGHQVYCALTCPVASI